MRLPRLLRSLAASPGFTATAVLTLALGIGAGTAIFTVVEGVLLRPLPFADPARLAEVAAPARGERDGEGWLSYAHFQLQRERNRSFSGMAACTFEIFNLTGHGEPEQIRGARVSWDFFRVLGVEPRLGRTFLQEEDRRGAPLVAMISDELRQRLFSGKQKRRGAHAVARLAGLHHHRRSAAQPGVSHDRRQDRCLGASRFRS